MLLTVSTCPLSLSHEPGGTKRDMLPPAGVLARAKRRDEMLVTAATSGCNGGSGGGVEGEGGSGTGGE